MRRLLRRPTSIRTSPISKLAIAQNVSVPVLSPVKGRPEPPVMTPPPPVLFMAICVAVGVGADDVMPPPPPVLEAGGVVVGVVVVDGVEVDGVEADGVEADGTVADGVEADGVVVGGADEVPAQVCESTSTASAAGILDDKVATASKSVVLEVVMTLMPLPFWTTIVEVTVSPL